jgi:hypothetical protein
VPLLTRFEFKKPFLHIIDSESASGGLITLTGHFPVVFIIWKSYHETLKGTMKSASRNRNKMSVCECHGLIVIKFRIEGAFIA